MLAVLIFFCNFASAFAKKRMSEVLNTKWQQSLSALKSQLALQVPKEQFGNVWSWFEHVMPKEYDNTTLVLACPTRNFATLFSEKYLPHLKPHLNSVFGENLKIRFVLDEAPASPAAGSAKKPQEKPLDPHLNPEFTFKNFVKGISNKAALNIAKAIAEKPNQTTFNPLFLYGPSGVGKTHLVTAVGHRIKEKFPEKRVLFVPAHLFKTQYTDAVRNNNINEFMHFYQSIDILIIDDIQELTTANTQHTFFHIFNHLHLNGRQIIITCDRAPVLFEGIEERMLTRFKWGIVMEMDRPDVMLRRDIVAAKIRGTGLRFPADVVNYIAENVTDNVRDLQGVVNSLMAFSMVDDCEIDLALAQRVVARVINLTRNDITLKDILQHLCQHFKVKQREIIEKCRKADIVLVRQLTMYLAQKYTKMSQAQIGQELGRRDHATVLYAIRQIERRIASDRDFRLQVEALEANLKAHV